jgi:hypothetical protein
MGVETKENDELEQFNFKDCQVGVIHHNNYILVCIEHSKPMSLVVLDAFTHQLGLPLSFSYEEGDEAILFLFDDKKIKNVDLANQWNEMFAILKKDK